MVSRINLGMPDEITLFCGLAIDWCVPELPIKNFERERASLYEQVAFLGSDEAIGANAFLARIAPKLFYRAQS